MRKKEANNRGFTIGELLTVLGIVLTVVFLLQPFVRQTTEKVDRAGCISNLRGIGRAMFIYAREHRKQFPLTIKTLYEEEYLADAGILDCPATKKTGTLDDPEYIYTPGLSATDPSDTELIKDFEGNHSGVCGILTVDGTVFWQENSDK
ncbi:MAG: type II secretion system GspH family protein [Candidatus Omnitrophica bacterium]|nr:type II secretion system GspH family protein [Candidatus Omnitrophota bacterium]MBU1128698.1 type II secretion system GspH family protein [Candidatus Omnitrophota bacterium]MBU1784813.1 type II secretion system GspH family protein [Candidatus Omnitrophota bacterium]MBU1850975.1 type II secretion system GspH family protein [Candidatus Omnitrophota bacterium]